MRGDGTDITAPCSAPWFNRTGSSKREAAIIGGIASALLSLALLRRGWQVTLYCADEAPHWVLPAIARGAVSVIKQTR
ncbi:hypothetical protein OIU89_25930 [Escherichia coli]|nr:hypothetical protein [Escherichia coli]